MLCPRRVARSCRSAVMSIGATTIRSPGPGEASREHASVEVHDLAAARPRVRRVVPQARPLIRRHDVGRVLERPAAVHDRPPVHRLGRAPGIHVRRDAQEHFGAVGGELADRLGKQPVVADRATDAPDRRVGDGEERIDVAVDLVRARVHLVRDPRVHLPVLVEQPFRTDQARRVEDDRGPPRIDLEHRPALDVDAVLARLAFEAIGVLVRNRDGQLVEQLPHARIHGRRMRELREHDEPHREEGRAPGDRRVDHREHAVGVLAHVGAVGRIDQIGLAGGGGVSDDLVHAIS